MKTVLTILALFASLVVVQADAPIDCGVLRQVKVDRKGDCFLNMGAAYPHATMAIVIFRQDRANVNLDDLRAMVGHHLLVDGAVASYRGRPEVVVHAQSSIHPQP